MRVDLGRATYRSWAGPEETRWFANIGSAGMSGAIAQRANMTTKALGGKASYLWATLAVAARWKNDLVTVTVGDEERHATMHDIGSRRTARPSARGMRICPEASAEDSLDVLLIGDSVTSST